MTWGLLRIDLNIIKIPWWSTIYYDYLYPSFIHSMFIELPFLLHLNPKTWGLAYFKPKQSKSTFCHCYVNQIFSADATKYRNYNLFYPWNNTVKLGYFEALKKINFYCPCSLKSKIYILKCGL